MRKKKQKKRRCCDSHNCNYSVSNSKQEALRKLSGGAAAGCEHNLHPGQDPLAAPSPKLRANSQRPTPVWLCHKAKTAQLLFWDLAIAFLPQSDSAREGLSEQDLKCHGSSSPGKSL